MIWQRLDKMDKGLSFLSILTGDSGLSPCSQSQLYCSVLIVLEWSQSIRGERTSLVVRASDSGSGDPGSILGRVGVLFP